MHLQLEKLDYDDIPSNDEALLSTNKELQSVDGELKKVIFVNIVSLFQFLLFTLFV